jgi:hypothetical protein
MGNCAAQLMQCTVEGCPNEAWHAGLCHGHEKQKAKGKRLTELGERIDGRGPKARWARLEAAAIRFADATEAPAEGNASDQYARVKHAFHQAVYRYILESGYVRFTKRDGTPLE